MSRNIVDSKVLGDILTEGHERNAYTVPILICIRVLSLDPLEIKCTAELMHTWLCFQLKVAILVTCMKPFSGSPSFDVKLTANGTSYLFPLRLPIVVSARD